MFKQNKYTNAYSQDQYVLNLNNIPKEIKPLG